jgi:hypothetical protein
MPPGRGPRALTEARRTRPQLWYLRTASASDVVAGTHRVGRSRCEDQAGKLSS